MQSDPLCPACTEIGWLVGRDTKGRELFACRTEACDVVEYDHEMIRAREGCATVSPAFVGRTRRGGPACKAFAGPAGRGVLA